MSLMTNSEENLSDNLGWIHDFREGGLRYRTLKTVSSRGSGTSSLANF